MMRSLFQHSIRFPRPALLAMLVGVALADLANAEPPGGPVRCILLRNGNVLEGKPVQEGDRVTILMGEHQSLRLPASQVLCWADDRYQLYRYRLDHRTKTDLRTHLDAARWCIRQRLLEPASAELRAARAIDAENPGVAQIQALLEGARQRAQESPDTSKPPPASEANSDQNEADRADPSAASLARLSRSTIADYASRVQPILINRCGQAGCHGGHDHSQTDWQLALPPTRQQRRLPAEMTRGNLHALTRWIDQHKPHLSPLLNKASQPHGSAEQSPLGLADTDVLVELESWVASVAGELQGETRTTSLASSFPSVPLGALDDSGAIDETSRGDVSRDRAKRTHPSEPPRPTRLPPVTNPFDPQLFNRLHHRSSAVTGR